MIPKSLLAAMLALAVPLSAPACFANAKVIHVPDVMALSPMPNPPASEDDAAAWQGKPEGLPKVWRLQQPLAETSIALTALARQAAAGGCPPLSVPPALQANPLYGPGGQTFGGRIVFPTPAWDSTRFLPAAGWSGQPGLWASHIR